MTDRKRIIEKASNDEERQLLSHAFDLFIKAEKTGRTFYTDFLTPFEAALLEEAFLFQNDVSVSFFGGFEGAERKMAAFGDEKDWPVLSVKISTKNSSPLMHRAVMGTVLSLGIERQTIGDIIIREDSAWVFCLESLSDFIASSVTKVGSVGVKTELCTIEDMPKIEKEYEKRAATVSSLRLDAVVSAATLKARGASDLLISKGMVFINSRQNTSKSASVEDGDVLTVRGEGKFLIKTQNRLTKKGRTAIEIYKYI